MQSLKQADADSRSSRWNSWIIFIFIFTEFRCSDWKKHATTMFKLQSCFREIQPPGNSLSLAGTVQLTCDFGSTSNWRVKWHRNVPAITVEKPVSIVFQPNFRLVFVGTYESRRGHPDYQAVQLRLTGHQWGLRFVPTHVTQDRTRHPGFPAVQLRLTCDQICTGSESLHLKYGAKEKKRNGNNWEP